ncbi:MAG: conserved hypothetical protein [Methanobrevibacter sp. CfCl-M3]
MSIKEDKINEPLSLPADLRNLIPEDHFAHIVALLVDSMDLSKIEKKYIGNPGKMAYNRKALLRVAIYAKYDKVNSSRKIAKALRENIIYMYLAGGNIPQYRSIINFGNECSEIIEEGLEKTVRMAKKLFKVAFDSIALDGTMIKANASKSSLIDEATIELAHELIRLGYDEDLLNNKLYSNETNPDTLKNLQTKDKVKELVKQSMQSVNKEVQDTFKKIDEKHNNKLSEKYSNKNKENNKDDNKEKNKENNKEENKENNKEGNKQFVENKWKLTNRNKMKVEKAYNEIQKIKEKDKDKKNVKVSLGDTDTRFMKNKQGVLELDHNLQLIVDTTEGIILSVDAVNDPTDHHQFKPQIENLKNAGYELNNTKILADSIYGTTKALEYIEKEKLDAYIPSRKQATKNKNKTKKKDNLKKYHKHEFTYDYEKNIFKCPKGAELKAEHEYTDGNIKYCNKKACMECSNEFKSKCTNENYRIIKDKKTQQQKDMENKMQQEESEEIYKKRNTVERTFGQMKKGLGYVSTNLTGSEKVKVEFSMVAITHNLKRVLNKATQMVNSEETKIMDILKPLI